MSRVQQVTTNEFGAEVLHADQPVLVDFYAPWCGPCRMVAPVLDVLAKEYAGRAKIVKVNVDEEPQLAAYYRISGIPALMFFKDGEVVDSIAGLASPTILRNKLERVIPHRRLGNTIERPA